MYLDQYKIEGTINNDQNPCFHDETTYPKFQEELEAEKNNCQVIWIKSKIITSNYKIFGELKFREKKTRNIDSINDCLRKIGEILQNKFKVFVRLRAFSIQDASIAALDLEN